MNDASDPVDLSILNKYDKSLLELFSTDLILTDSSMAEGAAGELLDYCWFLAPGKRHGRWFYRPASRESMQFVTDAVIIEIVRKMIKDLVETAIRDLENYLKSDHRNESEQSRYENEINRLTGFLSGKHITAIAKLARGLRAVKKP